jgi:hypothetical protein
MGKAILARIELNDTKRVRYKTSKKTPIQLKAVQGETAMMSPNKVATPFPPLNSAQMGKICPMTAASPSPI